MQIGQAPPHTGTLQGVWRGEAPAAYNVLLTPPPSLSSHPATGPGHPPARPRARPWHSVHIPPSGALPCHESPHARPRSDGQHEARGREGGPEAACIRTHIPPLGFMLALRTSGAGGWEFGDTIGPVGGGGNPGATDVYVAGRADVLMDLRHGYCLSGDRGGIRRRCFSTSCTLERTYVQVDLVAGTGYTS